MRPKLPVLIVLLLSGLFTSPVILPARTNASAISQPPPDKVALDELDRFNEEGAKAFAISSFLRLLKSGNLVRADMLGYELSGEKDFLDRAKYWAWTGVPFVYLGNPMR